MAPSAITPENGTSVPEKKPQYASGDPDTSVTYDDDITPPKFDDPYEERKYLKHRLAIAFRIFAEFGFAETVAGHITVRDPVEPDSFWVNPFGLHFTLIKDEDLIRVGHDGKVIEGGRNRRLNTAAYAIHAEIHKARPDVNCAAHAHSPYGRAMCATGRNIQMLTQDFCTFYNDIVVYPNFAGLVLANEEGQRIASHLGGSKAALLANHGLLTVGETIEAAVSHFVLLEKLCQSQLAADASSAGSGMPLLTIGHEEAAASYAALGSPRAGYFQGLPLFQVAERQFGESTYMGRGLEPL
ncbi:class 2 aldolase adducin domain-containing protein [Thozetella sp. PMI_491]|nr:class 2 aldolase adducin domain-containing protein [Thozetella sp. PMI_491]